MVKKTTTQVKKTTTATNGTLNGRRKVLGDMTTNQSKALEPVEGKKAVAGKPTLQSKTAPAAGVTKLTRTNSSRAAIGAKDNSVKPKPAEIKKPGSGSGVLGANRKRSQVSNTSSKDATPEVQGPPRKRTKEDEHDVDAMPSRASVDLVARLDAEDLDDPSMCAEYVREIFDYYKELELVTMPNANYMDHQDDLEWKMRGILVDWLIEVHTRFRLLPETLFLAINIVDRFLSSKVVPLDKLQLVGITAMFIASKYEEVLSPHVGNFVHVADDGFTIDEVLSAERYTLTTLKYDLSYPNPMNFLRRISKADNYDIQTRTVGKYLMEISLVDHRFLEYRQSHVAAASMYLARLILERGEWVCCLSISSMFLLTLSQDETLTQFSGYSEDEIQPVFDLLIDYLHAPVAHEALFKKYASKKFLKGKPHPSALASQLTIDSIDHGTQVGQELFHGTHW